MTGTAQKEKGGNHAKIPYQQEGSVSSATVCQSSDKKRAGHPYQLIDALQKTDHGVIPALSFQKELEIGGYHRKERETDKIIEGKALSV